ncbi:PhzF family phenazine biosynthesis protein [Streptomyces sp. DHE17-7]|uniref:PhzF family phenazine biosynthesis protein n=1 Tax=Streptomyces sp. DHE17-7 TaxID=2759949 RepID=UPI003FA6D2E5
MSSPLPGSPSPKRPARSFTLRFFSPKAEVGFCGHATVATRLQLVRAPSGNGASTPHRRAAMSGDRTGKQERALMARLPSSAHPREDAGRLPADVDDEARWRRSGLQRRKIDAGLWRPKDRLRGRCADLGAVARNAAAAGSDVD